MTRCGVPLPVLAEADEIFQGRQPCLTVVDGRSFLVLNLTPAAARDATTWGVTFLDLQARGVQFQDLASDGGTGIRAGATAAQLAVPLPCDLFICCGGGAGRPAAWNAKPIRPCNWPSGPAAPPRRRRRRSAAGAPG